MHINRQKNPVEGAPQAEFIRDSVLFSIITVLGAVSRLSRAFFIAKWLGPQAFGTWAFVQIFSNYIPLAGLGTPRAILRKIPFLRGRNDVDGIQAVLNTTSTTIFFGGITYSAIVFGWSFFLQHPSDAKALALYALVILLESWERYGKVFLLSTGLYAFRRRLELLDAILATLFPVALGYWLGVPGVIAGLGIAALIMVSIVVPTLWRQFAFEIDWCLLKDLILTGLSILADELLLTTMRSVDRILIAALLNREFLGLYGIASAGISILATIPSSLGRMLMVKFAEMHGQSKTSENMFSAFHQSTVVLASLFAPLIALATVFFPIAVFVLLPRFVEGIAAGKWLIASVFFIGISLPATNLCISTGRFKPVLVLRLIVVVAEFVAVYIVIRHNMRLEHIAFCIFCASAVFCAAMIITCNYLFVQAFRNVIYSTLNAILPFLSILSSLYIQHYIFPFENHGKRTDIITSCIVNLVVIFVVSAPFIYVVYRRIPIFQKLIWNTLILRK